MAQNSNRRSASSDFRRTTKPSVAHNGRPYAARPKSASFPMGAGRSSSQFSAAKSQRTTPTQASVPLRSVSVRDIDRASRKKRIRQSYRRYYISLVVIVVLIVSLVGGGFFLYSSPVFSIDQVKFNGAEHLTDEEMNLLADISPNANLLNVNVSKLRDNLLADAWIEDVSVNRVFPHTLEVNVTEREVAAIVEVPNEDGSATKDWAISADGRWLMPIPKEGTEEAARTSAKVYEDAAGALHITDVPADTSPEVGKQCNDANVNNALAIIDGLTTELAQRITNVKATEPESTTLTIKDGPDIVFGTADHVRDKERVCLKIMEEHPEGVAFINVRTVDRPTWRAL